MTNVIRNIVDSVISSDVLEEGDMYTGRQLYNIAKDYLGLGDDFSIIQDCNNAYAIAYKDITGRDLWCFYAIAVLQRRIYSQMMIGKHGRKEDLDKAYHSVLVWEWKLRDKYQEKDHKAWLH